jgi:hypothetical protein
LKCEGAGWQRGTKEPYSAKTWEKILNCFVRQQKRVFAKTRFGYRYPLRIPILSKVKRKKLRKKNSDVFLYKWATHNAEQIWRKTLI